MKIIIKELPGTTEQEEVDSYCRKYRKEGKDVKTERKGDLIQIYIEEIFDN